MKFYNEFGLEEDGKDSFNDVMMDGGQETGGITTFKITTDHLENRPRLTKDIDYKLSEMTKEQREVFEALGSDHEDDIYANIVWK